ncbi:MAG: phage capsid protein [Paludibacter sp.]
MATTETGNWLNQYVAPQLLLEFKNDKDDFLGVLPGANPAAITADGIRFNKLINNVGFFVNNTAAFVAKKMSGSKVFVEWEKYDTDPTEVDDAEIRGLNYDKRNATRLAHTQSMRRGIRDHVMFKLAPSVSNNADMPVMRTTGTVLGTRYRLSFADLIKYLELIKGLNLPDESQYFMILSPEHSTDLMIDRDSATYFADKNIFFDVTTGKVKSVMGFKFFENNAVLAYAADGTKKAKGAALGSTDRRASLFFYAPNSVYHLDSVKILYKPETIDTNSADPKSEFRLQGHGLIDRVVDYGFGAIVSGIVA